MAGKSVVSEGKQIALAIELIQLGARLQLLDQQSTWQSMVKFNIGQRVIFGPDGRMRSGVVIKFNPKTVVVMTDDGHRWKVSPQFLRHLVDAQAPGNITVIRPTERNKDK